MPLAFAKIDEKSMSFKQRPDTLKNLLLGPVVMSPKLVQQFQEMFNTEPDFDKIEKKAALYTWRRIGPMNVEDLLRVTTAPINLDESKHILK